jgi:hypothetical protein
MDPDELHALRDVRAALTQLDGREPSDIRSPAINLHGDATWWRGPFGVDDLAVSCVVAALESLAVLVARDRPAGVDVDIDAAHASAMFWAEALVEPDGWTIPPVWDPIAGDYEGADGWIRLHTNYAHHRTAALAALGLPDSAATGRDEVAATVANHPRPCARIGRDRTLRRGGCVPLAPGVGDERRWRRARCRTAARG